jgi:hypothetical protein
MGNKISLFIILACTVYACKTKENTDHAAQPTANNMPADFEVFYEKFGKDTAYQMKHIIFPLEGRPSLKNETDSIPPDFKWQKKSWVLHRTYDDMNGTFSRSFLNFHNIITEEITDNSGQFSMIRRFSKMDNDWYLIYYKEMGR